ncbi:437_t:CDS:1, partial [Gigaspora rosea]
LIYPLKATTKPGKLLPKLRILELEKKWEIVAKRKHSIQKKTLKTTKPRTYIPTENDNKA